MNALASTVSGIMTRFGERFTLRSVTVGEGANAWTAGAASTLDATVTGFEGKQKNNAFRGGLPTDDASIILDASSCPFEPKEGDKIARVGSTNWFTVAGVTTSRASGGKRLHVLTVRR